MNTVVIDYGSGNLRSVGKALEKAAIAANIETSIIVTKTAAALSKADRIVLPGVGAFEDCSKGLSSIPGMLDALEHSVKDQKKPFLGICVGMQLMANYGLENGRHKGFGWIPGEVEPIKPKRPEIKIPHMGWNVVHVPKDSTHPVLSGFSKGAHAYFVHSYFFSCKNADDVLATVDYDDKFPAIVGRENIIGTQFHPEKSQMTGIHLLEEFLKWNGDKG